MFAAAFATTALLQQPNFVLILADDLGYGDVGYLGSAIPTPNIDALAKQGLWFSDFHSNGAVCSPTRAALMTGRYQQRSGIEGVVTAANHRKTGLPLAEKTIAEYLASAGYRTGLFGKWHLGYRHELGPRSQGFHDFRGFVSGNVDYFSKIDQEGHFDWWLQRDKELEAEYLTSLITRHAVDFIQSSTRPFFCYVSHGAPHYPLQGPGDSAIRTEGNRNAFPPPDRPRAETYRQMVVELDNSVGRIVESLRDKGVEGNTLLIFMSDNGPAADGSAGKLRGRKGSLWEGGHRVPFVASWPGRVRSGITIEPAIGMDLLPTFASLAGVDTPNSWDGFDLSKLLLSRRELPDRDLFWRHANGNLAIRRGDWKWVSMGGGQLFDVNHDPQEKFDRSAEEPELAANLKAAAIAWSKEVSAGVKRRA